MDVSTCTTHHLVKSEDLNHHGTLYAGRNAEWFVEAGFIAAASLIRPENIVCLKIHGMTFTRPVYPGEIAQFESKIIYAGTSSLVAHVRMKVKGQNVVSGFITFVHVDADGRPVPHQIKIALTRSEDLELQQAAINLEK